ncbi:MAG: ribokinase [Eubacteriales bacterium]|nr:ribokinase [Eubacteriales bacterium]
MKIVNFGSLNIDYVYRVDEFLRPGETRAARSRSIFCGGKGLNQSAACAKAGLEVYHAGIIGAEGHFLKDKLLSYHVRTEFIREIPESNGHTIIQVNDKGENCILLYPGTNAMLSDGYVDEVLSHFGAGDMVVLQNETNMVGEIIEKAAGKGMRVAFNAAPYTDAVKGYPLHKVSWLFVNEIEGASLSGKEAFEDIARALRSAYPQTEIILTIGAQGCIYAGIEGFYEVPAQKTIPVDATAAGDTFIGYYLMCMLKGYGVRRALETANRAGAITVTRKGAADSIPSWEEVL